MDHKEKEIFQIHASFQKLLAYFVVIFLFLALLDASLKILKTECCRGFWAQIFCVFGFSDMSAACYFLFGVNSVFQLGDKQIKIIVPECVFSCETSKVWVKWKNVQKKVIWLRF